ncbi:hypothetical protein PoB_000588200 [Plakobranchus ocellatus]|uniref:Uncharacterized protein n=1 Tax=Plakobranchus ocellatus TaxID=259542 RepID=A0AAV3YAB9_9GAST|nr:hypothetical protein PoB_000588200 [Plakobranchus ocellatus]
MAWTFDMYERRSFLLNIRSRLEVAEPSASVETEGCSGSDNHELGQMILVHHYKLIFSIRMGLKINEIDLTTGVEVKENHWLNHNTFFDIFFIPWLIFLHDTVQNKLFTECILVKDRSLCKQFILKSILEEYQPRAHSADRAVDGDLMFGATFTDRTA